LTQKRKGKKWSETFFLCLFVEEREKRKKREKKKKKKVVRSIFNAKLPGGGKKEGNTVPMLKGERSGTGTG